MRLLFLMFVTAVCAWVDQKPREFRFRQAKQQLCTCTTLFCTFLCRRWTTTTWNCLISRFTEEGNKRQQLSFFFSWTLMQSFSIQLQEIWKIANIWRIRRDGISAIKFGGTNSLFKWRFRRSRRRLCVNSLMSHATEGWREGREGGWGKVSYYSLILKARLRPKGESF